METNLPQASVGAAVKKRNADLGKRIRQHKIMYLMLLPCLVFFVIFSYIPMGGLMLAFKNYQFNKGILGSPWVGLTYFKAFFNDYQSGKLIKNTLIISSIKVFVGLPFPILLALMFNEIRHRRFRGIAQSISYLPHFLSWVIVIGLMQRILAPDTGLLNEVIRFFGGDGSTFFMMESKYFYSLMFGSHIWQSIGWDSIIYLAAIAGINPELHEAAKIDGANKWHEIWHVTLPGIRLTISILFILSLGNILQAGFDQIYLMRTPGNMELADILDTYIIRVGLQNGQYGYATAVGLMQGIIGLILVVAANRASKKFFDESIW
ncbi:ABC transporter permease subunit [Paenibacillus chondroitinus]|uniref:ABC transporter permease subunit n=1 Tax=Paenibacillus chondroitinus TaxID=59842 RepID=A0ABU6DLF3_9BACL|nr:MULTISPECIES: ABC transporter permease subunit [Paenibacillus]MCY9657557.1 ABC transporter permease subunit [Paenibacillus anseongense]MEB4797793.1 ABC transporter permease subunit [Paenibacillus chondroitinus]